MWRRRTQGQELPKGGFKRQPVKGDGRPLTAAEEAQRLQAAIQVLETDPHAGLVRLASPNSILLDAGERLELRGVVEGAGKETLVLPRTAEQLPRGLNVLSAELISSKTVRCVVSNSTRHSIRLDHSTVLAEISTPVTVDVLVGPSCEVPVNISSCPVTTGLLDSGSQVTIVSEGFYKTYLSNIPLQPLDQNLTVVGAGGQDVPYLGAIMLPMQLPEYVMGSSDIFQVAALVGKDCDFSTRVPIIIGTNIYNTVDKSKIRTDCLRTEAAFALSAHVQDEKGRVSCVTLKNACVIPPQASTIVHGWARAPGQPFTHVLVHELVDNPIENVGVVAIKVSTDHLHDIQLELCNFSEEPILLKKGQLIADVLAIRTEYSVTKLLSLLHTVDSCTASSSTACSKVESDVSENGDGIVFKFGENVSDEWRAQFVEKLKSYSDVFTHSEFDIGRADTGHVFDIELEPGPPIRQRARPISPHDFEDCRQHIQGLLDAKIIQPSNSPYASPIVLCRKKNGDLRMCCDYRMINNKTIRDSYCVPKVEDLFMTLSHARYFTSLDLCKAYYQIPMTEKARKISAFCTVFGIFEWDRLSQGLVNAPACFQRVMETVFRDMNLVELIIFLDDILIHASSLEELEVRTIKVLDRLRKFKLKVDPAKCVFGATEIKHLGFLISENSIRPDPDKISAVTTWPKPTTVKEVKSFVGFCGHFRRFVRNFSSLAKPLNDLTIGYVPAKCRTGKKKPGDLSLSSNITHLWGEEQDQSFEAMKKALTGELVLGLVDKAKPFFLHCDASGTGLGAALYQEIGGEMKVIAYASRGLNCSEKNYPAHKREFLALKWSMAEKFRDYLLGSKVIVVTDNNPLCYVLKNAHLDATSHRWLSSLSLFDFELRYKKGSLHIDADALSRRPHGPAEEDEHYNKTLEQVAFLVEKAKAFDAEVDRVPSDVVSAIIQSHQIGPIVHSHRQAASVDNHNMLCHDTFPDKDPIPVVEQISPDPSRIPDDILEPKNSNIESLSKLDWRKLQLADGNLRQIIHCLEKKKDLVATEYESPEMKVFVREQKKLLMRDGVLHRRVEGESVSYQLVLPKSHRKQALIGVHDDLFHTHFDDAILHLRMRFFWPYMAKDLETKIKRCMRCIRKGARCQKAPMVSITTTFPLELLSIDYLTIEAKGQKQNILVVMDHFTKFGTAILTKDQTAKTTAKALWNNFFMVYGFPKRILSDQGRDFESKLLKEICDFAGISKCRTSPFHPSGNPVERFNRSLIGMIRSLEDEKKTDWRKSLPAVVHAYNCCIHQSTNFSPYYLFFGRHPRLPIDVAFGVDVEKKKKGSSISYVRQLKEQLRDAYHTASQNMKKASEKNKARYDSSAHAAELEVGDRVLVKKLGFRLDSKVSDRWEKSVYVVLSKKSDMPVYTVQDEVGLGPQRTLHRNHLLPIGMLDSEFSKRQVSKTKADQTKGLSTRQNDPVVESMPDEFTEQQDMDVKISILNPNSLEFVPRLNDATVGSEDITHPEPEDEIERSVSDHETENDDRGDQVVLEEGIEVDEEVGSVDNVTSEDEQGDSDNDSSQGEEMVESEDSPSNSQSDVGVRRSTRQRKPVQRLNLTHHVAEPKRAYLNVVTVGKLMYRLHNFSDKLLDSNRVAMAEHVMTGLLQIFEDLK